MPTNLHWMHERFIENILASSRAREFGEAAREWQLARHGHSDTDLQCNLCNTTINIFIVLHNTLNDNRLIIGVDCYDKFVAFLRTGKVESQLLSRSENTKALRSYFKGIVPLSNKKEKTSKAVKTVRGWLDEELEKNSLPDEIAAIVRTMQALGFTPSIEDADRVVAHYKATRKFPLKNFISEWELKKYCEDVPQEVTLDEFVEVNARFQKAKTEALDKAENDRLERIAHEEQIERTHWSETRGTIIADFESLKLLFSRVEEELPFIAQEIAPRMELLQKKTDALPAEYPGFNTHIMIDHRVHFPRSLVSEVRGQIVSHSHDMETWLAAPSEEVVVVPVRSPYILRKEGDHWRRVGRLEFVNKEWPEKAGMFFVRGLGSFPTRWIGEERERFVIAKEIVDSSHRFPVVEINTPSTTIEDAFIGFLSSKPVLPNQPVTEPGTYLCFVMEERERYCRVWIIAKES